MDIFIKLLQYNTDRMQEQQSQQMKCAKQCKAAEKAQLQLVTLLLMIG